MARASAGCGSASRITAVWRSVSVTALPIAPPNTMKPAANPPKPKYSDDDDHEEEHENEEHENEGKKDRENEEDEDDD